MTLEKQEEIGFEKESYSTNTIVAHTRLMFKDDLKGFEVVGFPHPEYSMGHILYSCIFDTSQKTPVKVRCLSVCCGLIRP